MIYELRFLRYMKWYLLDRFVVFFLWIMFCIWGFLNIKCNKFIFYLIVLKNIFLNNFKLFYILMFIMGYMIILLEIV